MDPAELVTRVSTWRCRHSQLPKCRIHSLSR